MYSHSFLTILLCDILKKTNFRIFLTLNRERSLLPTSDLITCGTEAAASCLRRAGGGSAGASGLRSWPAWASLCPSLTVLITETGCASATWET